MAVKSVKNRVFELLRKFGTGRRLCVDEDWVFVILVPAETVAGDEVWAFRGTDYRYVLRKAEEGKYMAVGEVCEYRCPQD